MNRTVRARRKKTAKERGIGLTFDAVIALGKAIIGPIASAVTPTP